MAKLETFGGLLIFRKKNKKFKLLSHGPKWLSESRKIDCFGLVS